MHSKIPAILLLCAALGWIAPGNLKAGDKKKSAEARKSEPAKKPQAKAPDSKKPDSKKPRSEQKSPRRDAVQAQLKKLEDQLAESRKELEKSRDSFHTAQKELAAKAQEIKALESKNSSHESALKKMGEELRNANGALKNATLNYGKASDELRKLKSMDFNKLAHALDDERKKNAALQAQLKETQKKTQEAVAKANAQIAAATLRQAHSNQKATAKKAEPKKPEQKKVAPKKPEPRKTAQSPSKSPTVAPIQYDLNSAVNFKERDRVLNELRAILKRAPKARIQITGYADDTPYKKTNDEVGANRARYLAKYLSLKGLPENQIDCRGIGSAKQGRGNGNRKAVIQIRS